MERIAKTVLVTLTLFLGSITTSPVHAQTPPYPQSTLIRDIQFNANSHRREGIGADNWATTWAGDDHQYSAWGDGWGFNETQSAKRSLGVSRILGAKNNYTGTDIWTGTGKSYGIISLDSIQNQLMYMWVSPGSCSTNFSETVLNESTNRGNSWSPTTVKFTKTTHDLMVPTILQFGKGYAGVPSSVSGGSLNYTYHYFIEHITDSATYDPYCLPVQKPGRIYLARVPVSQIKSQASYEFFSGTSSNPQWGPLSSKQPVFADSQGVGWNMSVSYNPGLGRYFLMTEHTQSARGNLGIFESTTPWGPWKTVKYYNGWDVDSPTATGRYPLN